MVLENILFLIMAISFNVSDTADLVSLACRPLMRIINHLLVMGALETTDMRTILGLLDPRRFPTTPSWRVTKIQGSLLDLPLPESVKGEVCSLFHTLCDLQLRHRVESTVFFSNLAVSAIQAVSRDSVTSMRPIIFRLTTSL